MKIVKYIYKPSNKEKGFWQPYVNNKNILEQTKFYFRNQQLIVPQLDLEALSDGDEGFIDVQNKQFIIADETTSIYYRSISNELLYIGPILIVRDNVVYIIKHLSII